MASLSLAILPSITVLYVTVTSISLVSGMKAYDICENPQLPYMCTFVFGLSHRGFTQNCPYPYPPSKMGTMPSDCPFSGQVVSKV